jgi:hypothetical protein
MVKIKTKKGDKGKLEKRCRQLQKEREEMWERLGMNWRKGVCSPNPKDIWCKTSFKLLKTKKRL